MNKLNEIMNLKTWLLLIGNMIIFSLLSNEMLIRSFFYSDKAIFVLTVFLFLVWFLLLIPSIILIILIFVSFFLKNQNKTKLNKENREMVILENNRVLFSSLISIILLFLTFSYYHDKEISINAYKEFYKDVKEDKLMETAYKSFKQDVPITYGYLEQILNKHEELQLQKNLKEIQEDQLSDMSEKNKVLKQLKQIHNS